MLRPVLGSMIAAVVTLLGSSAITSLSAQTAADTLHACYVPGSGTLYRIKATGLPAACVAGTHVALSWNVRGAPGETGPAGTVATNANGSFDFDNVNGFVANGSIANGAIPATGASTSRLMWYAGKAALRAGNLTSNQWDEANIGNHSVAIGASPTASGIGSVALGTFANAGGPGATAIGQAAAAAGENAMAYGYNANAGGFRSLALGALSSAQATSSVAIGGGVTTAGANGAIAMGFNAMAVGSNSFAIGNAQVNGAGSIVISTSGSSLATAFHDGSIVLSASAEGAQASRGRQIFMKADSGVFIITDVAGSAGVNLPTGGGSWTTNSDRNRKQNFRDIDGEVILDRISTLPISEWSYRAEPGDIRHIGPMAQDFYAAFGLGTSDLTITTSDISGVNMAAIQALVRRTESLQAENAALQQRVDALETMVRALLQSPAATPRDGRR